MDDNSLNSLEGIEYSLLPDELVQQWRMIMTVVARTLGVSVGLVTRVVSPTAIEMTAPDYESNLYKVGSLHGFQPGLYCERVTSSNSELLVRDASSDEDWHDNPDMELGLVAYLGFPLRQADGQIMGTICVLNRTPRDFSDTDRKLLLSARDVIEESLTGFRILPPSQSRYVMTNATRIGTWDVDIRTETLRLSESVASQYWPISAGIKTPGMATWLGLMSAHEAEQFRALMDDITQGRRRMGDVAFVRQDMPSFVRIFAHSLVDESGKVVMISGLHVAVAAHPIVAKLEVLRLLDRDADIAEFAVADDGTILSATPALTDLLTACGLQVHDHARSMFGQFRNPELAIDALQAMTGDYTREMAFAPLALRNGIASRFIVVTRGAKDPKTLYVTILPEHIEAELPQALEHPDRDVATGLATRQALIARLGSYYRRSACALAVVEITNVGSLILGQGYVGAEAALRKIGDGFTAPDRFVVSLGFGHFAVVKETTALESFAETLYDETQRVAASLKIAVDASVGAIEVSANDANGALVALADATEAVRSTPRLDGGPIYISRRGRDGQRNWAEAVRNFDSLAEKGDIQLVNLPIISTRSENTPSRGEFLLRLKNDDGSLISGGPLVATAEEHHVVDRIDCWVLDKALQHLSISSEPWVASINVSGRTLRTRASWETFLKTLDRYTVDPARLFFEITETSASRDATSTNAFINTVRERGCGVSIDDFGTGANSLAILHAQQVDEIKIDQSFVRGVPGGGVAVGIVQGVVLLAQAIGAKTVAEGVADASIDEAIRGLGVDFVQGFHFGLPTPLSEIVRPFPAKVSDLRPALTKLR